MTSSAFQLSIAKASLSAALLRPDPVSVSADGISLFHSLLDKAIAQCSPSNIQTCKQWILENVSSTARIKGLGKYLAALCATFMEDHHDPKAEKAEEHRPTSSLCWRRKCLHLLYLINDLLHHTKFRTEAVPSYAAYCDSLKDEVVSIVRSTASCDVAKYPKHHKNLNTLLDIWAEKRYFAPDFIAELRDTAKTAFQLKDSNQNAQGTSSNTEISETATSRADTYVMPLSHGDPTALCYDLPAGDFIQIIIPNSMAPINPRFVRPPALTGRVAQPLVDAVKELVADKSKIYCSFDDLDEESPVTEMDELGQELYHVGDSTEFSCQDTYFGWPLVFCERAKARQREIKARGRAESTEYEHNDDYGYGSGKRRRYSDSLSSRSRSASGSYSRSRSRDSRPILGSGVKDEAHPNRRSLSPRRFDSNAAYRARSRSRSHSPRSKYPSAQLPAKPTQAPPIAGSGIPQLVGSFSTGFPLGPGGMPIPPPPPTNFSGTWKALPPGVSSIPGVSPSFVPSFPPSISYPGPPGTSFSPPPPPPDLSYGLSQQGSYGRRGGYRGRGREYDSRRIGGRGVWQR